VITNPRLVRSAAAAASVPASWFALLVAVPAVLVGQGWEPWEVGVLLLPSVVVAVLMPRAAGAALRRTGATGSLALAAVVAATGLALAAAGTALVSPVLLVVSVMAVTVGFGLGQPAMVAAASEAVEEDVRGVALGIATLVFLAGGSIGSAVVGGLGDAVSIPVSLAVLAVLPLLALLVLRPILRSGAGRAAQPSAPS
jgi:MFS family permease